MRIYETTDQNDQVALFYLDQLIEMDGFDETVLAQEQVTNGSGRFIGHAYCVSDRTARTINDCVLAATHNNYNQNREEQA